MHEGFIRIARGYLEATSEAFARHPMASFVRIEMPQRVRALLGPAADNYRVEGSAGLGRWSNSPWIAVLDPLVTDSAMRGYYPVYLFSPEFDRVSLVLGQGTYSVRDEFGSRGADVLRERAEIIRTKVPEFRPTFSSGPFPIVSSAHAGGDWTTASVFGRTYTIAELPSNEELAGDLRALLRLYNIATARGGYILGADDEHDGGPPPNDPNAREQWEDGERRLRQHESAAPQFQADQTSQAIARVCMSRLRLSVRHGVRSSWRTIYRSTSPCAPSRTNGGRSRSTRP